MMNWLAQQGYDCTVVTTYPYYPQWKIEKEYKRRSYWYSREQKENVQVHRCPHYVPSTPGGIKRMMLDLTFTVSAFFKILQLACGRRREIVMVVAPPFVPGFLGVIYKWLRGAKLVYHVQDLQIEAARDLQMVRSKKIIRLLFGMERFILKRTDQLSSISTGMVKKMEAKTGRDIVFFPNWSDTTRFFPLADKDLLKEQFGFSQADKILLYSGAIGEKQGLDILLHAAGSLKELPELKFIICGTGPYKENLQAMANEMGLDNVHFLSLQPAEKLNHFLNMADVHLVIQKADASDLVMPSKLTNILAVGGLAVVTAVPGTSLFDEINDHQMGIVAESENIASFVDAVKRSITTDCSQLKHNARKYAENYLSIEKVMQRFSTGLQAIQHNKRTGKNVQAAP
jgi:colanic acid biosynthesis glycosyl transferase WcaI